MKDKEKPSFSRNLEISKSSGDPGRSRRLPSGAAAESMSPEEKQMYFRVEGRKILEMLAVELERPEPDPVSIVLISDLHRSWRALWRGDDSFPVGPFSEMFELVFSMLSSIAFSGRKTGLEERMLLDDLKEYMGRLVSGEPGVGCLDACRRLIEKAAPVAGRLKRESMPLTGKAAGRQEVEGMKSRESRLDTTVREGRGDISSSVDEWFDQVTRLMVQPRERNREETPGLKPVGLSGRESDPTQSGPSRQIEKSPPEDQIVLFPGETTAGREKEKAAFPGGMGPRLSAPPVKAAPGDKRETVAPKADKGPGMAKATPQVPEVTPPATEGPSLEVPGAGSDSTPKGHAPDVASGQPRMSPRRAAGKTPGSGMGKTADSPAPPPEVMAYFHELSLVTLEVLSHNLSDVVGVPGRRGARLVGSYLDQLRGVAYDFGLEGFILALEGVRESLDRFGDSRSEREKENLLRQIGEFADRVSGCLN